MPWLIAALASLLALGIAPLTPTCSNDGSHLMLALSLSEGKVALGDRAVLASVDHAEREGVVYSDRAPGQAFLLVPLIWLGLDPRLLSALAFGGTLAVLYGWLRRDGCSAAVAGAIVLVGATTLLLRYAPVLFAHSLTAFLLTLSGRLATGPMRHGWLLGLTLGWLGITEYGLALLAIAAALVAWRHWPSFYLGLALPVAAAATYHWAAFGAPWYTGYHFQGAFPAARTLAGGFAGPLWSGLVTFAVAGTDAWGNQNSGLLRLAPVLALAPFGLWAMARERRGQAILLAVVCGGYLLLYSQYVAFAAGTHDSRYYVPFLPLLLVAIGHLLARVGWPAWLAVGALAAVGLGQLLPHMRSSFGFHGAVALRVPVLQSTQMQLGRVFEMRGDPDRAAAEYESALRFPLPSRGARGNLGAIRLAQGRLDEAVPLLAAALRETPDDGRVLTSLGTVALQQQRPADAVPLLERAVAVDPQSSQAHNNLGVALAQQGRWGEAAAEFERTLAIDPNHAMAARSLAYAREQLGR